MGGSHQFDVVPFAVVEGGHDRDVCAFKTSIVRRKNAIEGGRAYKGVGGLLEYCFLSACYQPCVTRGSTVAASRPLSQRRLPAFYTPPSPQQSPRYCELSETPSGRELLLVLALTETLVVKLARARAQTADSEWTRASFLENLKKLDPRPSRRERGWIKPKNL